MTNSNCLSNPNPAMNKIISTKDTNNSKKKSKNDDIKKRETQQPEMDKMNEKLTEKVVAGK